MRLSVVVPVRNEAAGIVAALLPLQALRGRLELIVVDGGSSDNTCELARPWVDMVLTSKAGRAAQMNAGAAVASGDVLLFLHADTRLPEGFVDLIEAAVFGQPAIAARPPLPPSPASPPPSGSGGLTAMAQPHLPNPWGRFDVRLSPASPLLNLVAWMMNQRSRLTGICTGDQAIFVRRDLFEQLGGYADLPLMEDIELSRRLRTISSPACLRPPVTTSSRKWQQHGVWRTIIMMWWIRLQYWAGVSPERLVQQYYGAASPNASVPGVSSSFSTPKRPPRLRWPRWNSALPGVAKNTEQEQPERGAKPGVSSSISTPRPPPRLRWPRWNSALPGVAKNTEQDQSVRGPKPGVSSSTSTPKRLPWLRWPRWNSAFPGVRQPRSARPLLIFAKAPIPGTVKTRLIPALGAEGACDLYQQLLRHTLQQTRDWPGPRFLYCAPDTSHPLFARLATEQHLQLRQQHGDDLGSRMAQALAEHPDGGLLIGTDCPLISTALLLQADQALHTHDTAIIPSEDGGYVLIGQRQPDPAAFMHMRWSHAEVMTDTRERLTAAGNSLWVGPTLWDLDEPADLPRLAAITLPPAEK